MFVDPASSALRTPAAARLIQFSPTSAVRFSIGRIARRSGTGRSWREQPGIAMSKTARTAAYRRVETTRGLQDTRLERHQILEFLHVLHLRELRILMEFVAFLEAFLERLPHIKQCPLGVARLRVRLREIVVEFRALFDRPLLQQHALRVAVLEDFGIEREGRLVRVERFLVLLT